MHRAITFAVWAAFAIAAPAAASAGAPSQIIGGTPTVVGQYPSVAVLIIGDFMCTGTLVAPSWVLTAAHCLDPVLVELPSQEAVTAAVEVHLNTVDIVHDPGRVLRASATYTHPRHNLSQLAPNDVGLIRLATPVTDIAPSRINFRPALAQIGATVTLVGFGQTVPGRQGPAGVEYELRDQTAVSCANVGAGTDDALLCYSQVDRGICFGDSGGPAFDMAHGAPVLVGVTARADSLCTRFGASDRVDVEREFLVGTAPELAECRGDADCASGQSCFAHGCIALPFTPGGLGATCTRPSDCDSATCATRQGEQRCAIACSPAVGDRCPDGFTCSVVASSSHPQCWPDAGGCCQVGGDGGAAATLLGLGVLVALRRRRR